MHLPSDSAIAGATSILHAFLEHEVQRPDRIAARVKKDGNYQPISWKEMVQTVKKIASGLLSLGIQPREHVCIVAGTSLEWAEADLGVVYAGGATVPIYHSNTPDECAYILEDADAVGVFVEDEKQFKKIEQVRERLPKLKWVVYLKGGQSNGKNIWTLDALCALGQSEWVAHEGELQKRLDAIRSEDILTIIYTSGTTGAPKGAMITHANMLYQAVASTQIDLIRREDDQLTFLPLAHVLAKHLACLWLYFGHTMSFAESVDTLVQNMAEAKPTIMVAVPRIFEKVYAKVVASGLDAGGVKAKLFKWALSVQAQVAELEAKQVLPAGFLALQWTLAQKLVFSKVREKLHALFGGRLRYFISGGAPLSPKIAYFFRAAGVNILEGYGLTETSGAICVNRLQLNKIGTVGPCFPSTQIKIATDGEILVKGPGVMTGYYKKPEATKEAIVDGWFHTGDIGEFDQDQYLKITDRKKDIIVTAAGKKIPPQEIENQLKTYPLISQAVVLGDQMKYLVALITLNPEQAIRFSSTYILKELSLHELANHPVMMEAIQKIIDRYNQKVASFEQIKKFAILPSDFSQETGEMTPSLKVKRKVVMEKYKQIIGHLYADN